MALRYNITVIRCESEYKRFVTPERFDPISFLAKGSQGIVCKGWDSQKNKSVVIKQCIEPFSDPEIAKRFYREFVLNGLVNHRNIIKLEYAYTPETSAESFRNMYLIFEKMDSTLFNFRRQESRRFDGEKGSEFIGILFHQFLCGLQYLHQPNLRLIHRDLSSNNILIKKLPGHNYNYCLKIADLGMARQLPFWDDADLTKSIGTMPYRAPEIRISTHYGTAVDLWSAGCILYEMITGKILFPTKWQDRLMLHIARMIPITDEEFSQLPWHLQENILINEIDWTFDLLNKEIQEYGSLWNQSRISLNQYNELLHRLLSFNPAKRFTAEQTLRMSLWNYLKGCEFYNPALLNHVTSLPYIEEHNNNGTIVEWRQRLFEKIIPFRAMQDLNNE